MNYMMELRSCLNGSRSKMNGCALLRTDSFKSEVLVLVETAPKVHYGEPHEVRMMAQKTGYYTEDYRKRPVQTDAPRDYIDRFTQLFVVTDYARRRYEAMKDNPAVRWVFSDHPNTSLPVSAIMANISRTAGARIFPLDR